MGASSSDDGAASSDVVLVYDVTPDREGLEVLRKRDETLELGTVRPLREGAPVHGEVVRLKPRPQCPVVCDVEVELPAKASVAVAKDDAATSEARRGPAQVATHRYRENWDTIFSSPRKVLN